MRVLFLVILFIGLSSYAFAGASGSCYFDNRTGHKYIKTNGDYSEYTKAGAFFKSVGPELPLLNNIERVTLVSDSHYIIYHRKDEGRDLYKTLPALSPHPSGWKAIKLCKSSKCI